MTKRKEPEVSENVEQEDALPGPSNPKKRKHSKKTPTKPDKPDTAPDPTEALQPEKDVGGNEDELDTGAELDTIADDAEYERRRKEDDEQARVKMTTVLATFTPDQMDRYECYRRSALQRGSVKKLMHTVSSATINLPMSIIMAGVAKLYVGELVETGLTVMYERNETGPLRPDHIREAYRRIQLQGKLPTKVKAKPKLFR